MRFDSRGRCARPVLSLLFLLAIGLPFAPTATGQPSDNPLLNPNAPGPGEQPAVDEDKAVPAPESIQHLDLEALLLDDLVLSGQIEDPVWQFPQTVGRRLVQLPIRVDRVDQLTELDDPAMQLRGGRFIGWRIVPDDANNPRGSGRRNSGARVGDTRGLDFSDPLLMEQDFDLGGPTGPDAPLDIDAELPDGAPMISRSVLLTPSGTVRWELDRALGSAEVKEGQEPYLLRLRPDRMKELEPPRPERIERGDNEDPRTFQQRRREQDAAYRDAQRAFRDLRDVVRDLPDTFEAPMPSQLWAVYDMTEAVRDLSMTGPEPLPWRIDFEQFETLKEIAGMNVGEEPSFEDYKRLNQLTPIAADNHPYSHRLLALALSSADAIGKAKPKDPLHRLLEKILAGPDQAARRIVLRDLVTTVPPTASTRMLLADAADLLTPQMKLASLRGALSGAANDPQQVPAAIAAAADALSDPEGPPAGGVLAALNESIGSRSESYPAVIAGIDLSSLPEGRRDDAIAYVIRSAGTSPLSATWLSGALLGSNDPAVVHRTLELLAAAGPGSPAIGAMSDALLTALFGPPTGDAQPTLDLSLEQPIPLPSASHPLFRSLNSGDPATRELAWRALPNFVVPTGGRGGTPAEGASDPVDMILISALGRASTPPQVVPFVEELPDQQRSTAALVRLIIEADAAASRRAANALFGDTQRQLNEPMRNLAPSERATFAARIYQARTKHTPLVTGLMREPESGGAGFVNWFAERVRAGELPTPPDWAENARGEETLLRLAASNDAALAAGAVAALVASAGGDTLTAQQVVDAFAAANDRTVAGLTAKWAETRRDIFRQRIKQAEGSYRLVLMVPETNSAGGSTPGAAPGSGPSEPPTGPRDIPLPFAPEQGAPMTGIDPMTGEPIAETPMTKIVLGVVDLIVDNDQVRIGNDALAVDVPDDRLAIRVTSLVGLSRFDEAQDLKLDLVTEPVDLLPRDDGTWRGTFAMPTGGTAELRLEPTESPS